jgi:cell division protein FtsQ
VLLPGEDQDAALDRLQMLQGRMELLDRPVQVIDLRLADRVVVRPRVLPPVAPVGDNLPGAVTGTGGGTGAAPSTTTSTATGTVQSKSHE